jgi:O-antigen/teichoic acid export membrane protein
VTAFAAAAVNLGLGLLLIPRFGILGAGCGALASFVVWNGLNIYFSTKFYRMQFDVRRLVHSLLLGAFLVAVAQFLPANLNPLVLWPLKGLLVVAYPVLLVATGFLRPEERQILIGLIRRAERVRGPSSSSLITVNEPMAVGALTSLD